MYEYNCKFLSHKYMCKNTTAYYSYLTNMSHVEATDVSLPPSINVLFFGTSILGQIVDSILCANKHLIYDAVDHRTLNTLDNRFTQKNKKLYPGYCKNQVCNTHEFATYTLYRNTRLTSVINWPQLQRFSHLDKFEVFIQDFDRVYFMLPHPECFFDWLTNKTMPYCVNIRK